VADVAVWLEAWLVARTLKSRPRLFPLANLAHLLGIALLVGAIAALDLRLLDA
jgi:Tfp pilus assembly protein PilN